MQNKWIWVTRWNAVIDRLKTLRLNQGTNTVINQIQTVGQVVSAKVNAQTLHPWKISVKWSLLTKQYFISLQPGFVNGRSAKVSLPDAKSPQKRTLVDLTDLPDIPVPNGMWTDGTKLPVRQFFLDLGVQQGKSDQQLADAVIAGQTQAVTGAATVGLLRVDVVLSVQKLIANGEIFGVGDEVQYSYKVANNSVDVRMNTARIVLTPHWTGDQPVAPDLTGQIEESGFDEVLLATVYLLTPDATTTKVSGQETVYVAQSVFWNLGYQPFLTLLNYNGTTLTPKIAFGDIMSAATEISRLEAIMAQPFGVKPPSNKGYFWTL
jgi:hypothetical protein